MGKSEKEASGINKKNRYQATTIKEGTLATCLYFQRPGLAV